MIVVNQSQQPLVETILDINNALKKMIF